MRMETVFRQEWGAFSSVGPCRRNTWQWMQSMTKIINPKFEDLLFWTTYCKMFQSLPHHLASPWTDDEPGSWSGSNNTKHTYMISISMFLHFLYIFLGLWASSGCPHMRWLIIILSVRSWILRMPSPASRPACAPPFWSRRRNAASVPPAPPLWCPHYENVPGEPGCNCSKCESWQSWRRSQRGLKFTHKMFHYSSSFKPMSSFNNVTKFI